MPAPRRGPGPLRWPRQRRSPRGARLLHPAPPPEDPRGDAVAGGRPGAPRPTRQGCPPAGERRRLRERRDVRVPSDRPRRGPLPRDEHPPPGGAPRHRARDRARPRRRSAPDRGRGTPGDRPGGDRRGPPRPPPPPAGTVPRGVPPTPRSRRWLTREPAVRDGQARIDTLERIWPPDDWQARTSIPASAWTAAASAPSTGVWGFH